MSRAWHRSLARFAMRLGQARCMSLTRGFGWWLFRFARNATGAAMDGMPHMQTLDTKKSRGNGKAQICALRIGAELGLQVPDPHMPATQPRIGRGERCARALAGEILARTAKSWGVTK